MQNQFCKKCGQANFPNERNCSKCGQPLGVGADAFGSGYPPPTKMPGQIPPRVEKKSKTIYWIVGGLAAAMVIFVGLAVIVAAGIFLYTTTGDEVTHEYPATEKDSPDRESSDERDSDPPTKSDSDNPLDDITFPSGKDVTFGDETNTTMNDKILLNFFLQKKAVIGRFRLVEVKTTTDRNIFPNRSAGVQAEYKNGRKRIYHRVAIYRSLQDARNDIETYKRNVKNSGARIRSSKEDQLIFVLKGLVFLAFYNQQGGLHEISSRNGNDILRYHKNYFK